MFFYDHSEHRNILVSVSTKTSGIYYSKNALHWLPTVAITAFNYSVYLSTGINNDFSRTTIVNQELHMHNQSHQPTQTYTLYTNPHLHPSNHACMGSTITSLMPRSSSVRVAMALSRSCRSACVRGVWSSNHVNSFTYSPIRITGRSRISCRLT